MKFDEKTYKEIQKFVNIQRNAILADAGFNVSLQTVNEDGYTHYKYTITNGKFTASVTRDFNDELMTLLDLYLLPDNTPVIIDIEKCRAYDDCYKIAKESTKYDTQAKQIAEKINNKLNQLKVINIKNGDSSYKRYFDRYTPQFYCSDIVELANAQDDIKNLRDSLYNIDVFLDAKYDNQIKSYSSFINIDNSNGDENAR